MFCGINLVNNIVILSEEIGLTRKEFAEQMGFNQSTIATWKTKNILPPVDTIFNIARRFEVSIEWLMSDNTSQQEILYRKLIRKRIYESLSKKLNIENADDPLQHKIFFTNMPNLTYRVLFNWAECRINLNLSVLQEIAYSLGENIEYLFGIDFDFDKDFAQNDRKILETAQRNLNDLFCLDNLTEDRKKSASMILNQLMKLEHLEYIEKQKNNNT